MRDITITCLGDIIITDPVYLNSFLKNENEKADIVTFNLETLVADKEYTSIPRAYSFKRKNEELMKALDDIENNCVFNVSNNHCLDYGVDCFNEMISNFKDRYGVCGYISNREEDGISYRCIDEKIIAFLGCSNFNKTTYDTEYNCCGYEHIIQKINIARKKADYVILHMHWGEELSLSPHPKQVKLAHELVDCGVDIIVGHHPHVLQGIEKYKDGLIIYSLGNFNMITYDYCPETSISQCIRIKISECGLTYSCYPLKLIDCKPSYLKNTDVDFSNYLYIIHSANSCIEKNSLFRFAIYSSKNYILDSLKAFRRRRLNKEKNLFFKILRWFISKKTIVFFVVFPLSHIYLKKKKREYEKE